MSAEDPVVESRVLLIVDDEDAVCRALARVLGRNFDRIATATASREAVALLKQVNVTHLLCDYWLGPGEPPGAELAAQWRRTYRSILRVVILSGDDMSSRNLPKGIDANLSKSADKTELLEALG
jgi:CheY-like chemotaxis protein